MKALRPDALLAVEAGTNKLEAQRHLQFVAYGIPGESEWYQPAAPLLAFIADLAACGPVPELATLLLPQSAHDTHCEFGHRLIPENVLGSNAGGRTCRVCHRARLMRSRAQKQGIEYDLFAEADRHYARIIAEVSA